MDKVYPIGSIYLSVNNTNPSSLFGGEWSSWGAGCVPVGFDASQTEFNTSEKTGGSKTHVLTVNQIPPHNHSVSGGACTTGANGNHAHTVVTGNSAQEGVKWTSGNGYRYRDNVTQRTTSTNGNHNHSVPAHNHTVGNTGGGQAHNNLQPYIVCYMWKRVG